MRPRKYRANALAAVLVVSITIQAPLLPALAASLYLEVSINGQPTHLIGAFETADGEHLSARLKELRELGLELGPGEAPDAALDLETVPGLSYRYDFRNQSVDIEVADDLRATTRRDALSVEDATPAPTSGFGTVLNYDLFASAGATYDGQLGIDALSANFIARAFTPLGFAEQTGVLRGSVGEGFSFRRLDTTLHASNADLATSASLGDAISGGLAWTRPIRFAGMQLRRNFGLRPDLITRPLLDFGGSAAVPSTVDVYIQGLHAYSTEVGPGPFAIDNVPTTTGSGEAKLVIRDPSGRAEEISRPFYSSPDLLRPGFFDFSFEAGFPRMGIGTDTDTYYVNRPVVSGSLRAGLLDFLTAEAHAEAGADILNAGIGAVVQTGTTGVAALAVSASIAGDDVGLQAYGAYELDFGGFDATASVTATLGSYADLASTIEQYPAAASPILSAPFRLDLVEPGAGGGGRTPEVTTRLALGLPVEATGGTFGASHIARWSEDELLQLFSASYSQPIGQSLLDVGSYIDLGEGRFGVLVGLSASFGEDSRVATRAATGSGRTSLVSEVMGPQGTETGGTGWRVLAELGEDASLSASIDHRLPAGRLRGSLSVAESGLAGTAEFSGAVVAMGPSIMLAQRIEDSFAIIETGAPGVPVLYENRLAGVTDSSGRILLPGLRSYESNRIAIDPTNLPVDATLGKTSTVIVPADHSGTLVDLTVASTSGSGVLVLSRPNGAVVPVGAVAQVGDAKIVVGYDGHAYVAGGLNARNVVTVELPDGTCSATFAFRAEPGRQVFVPVVCQ